MRIRTPNVHATGQYYAVRDTVWPWSFRDTIAIFLCLRNPHNFALCCRTTLYKTYGIRSAKDLAKGTESIEESATDEFCDRNACDIFTSYIFLPFSPPWYYLGSVLAFSFASCTSISPLLLLRCPFPLNSFGRTHLRAASKILLPLKPREPRSFLTEGLSHPVIRTWMWNGISESFPWLKGDFIADHFIATILPIGFNSCHYVTLPRNWYQCTCILFFGSVSD